MMMHVTDDGSSSSNITKTVYSSLMRLSTVNPPPEKKIYRCFANSKEHGCTTTQYYQQQQQQQDQSKGSKIESLVSPRNRATTSRTFRAGAGSFLGNYLGLVLITLLFSQACAWGNSGSSSLDYSLYGNGFTRDWLNDGSTLSFQVLGCVWGMVDDSEEAGCLEDESEDGTYNWYMMANCRRPQVAYSVFASSGCNSNYFVGSVRHNIIRILFREMGGLICRLGISYYSSYIPAFTIVCHVTNCHSS
jgi:hypothetical protein